jgi:hypothetical protein
MGIALRTTHKIISANRNSSGSSEQGFETGCEVRIQFPAEMKTYFFLTWPDRLWGPCRRLTTKSGDSLSEKGRSVNLRAHIVVMRSRMLAATPVLTSYPHGEMQEQFELYETDSLPRI